MEKDNGILIKDDREAVLLRAHHGMCLAYFSGHGYSDDFTAHMKRVKDRLSGNTIIKLAKETDIICSKCPNNIDGECEKPDLVARYDYEVLARCGLKEGDELTFKEFDARVREKILEAGLRSEICGDCQWNELCIG